MSLKQTFVNPFYGVLLLAGFAFSVTACAYGVLYVRGIKLGALTESAAPGQQLMVWLDQHGSRLMLAELVVLAVACLLAITTDSFWERRAAARQVRDKTA